MTICNCNVVCLAIMRSNLIAINKTEYDIARVFFLMGCRWDFLVEDIFHSFREDFTGCFDIF